jgi:hypothetical protein
MEKFYSVTRKSFDDLEVKTELELWNKVKGEYKGLSCEFPVAFEKTIVKNEDKEEEVMTMVISTADEDRHGDIVVQDWDLKWFKKNPVLLDSHNYDSITHILGKMNNVRTEGTKTKAEPEYAEMNPKGALAKQMAQAGFINTSSVGFIPKEFDNDGKILKSELLEVSLVSVPANARALFEKMAEETTEEIETLKTEIEETPEEEAVEKIIETKIVIDKKKVILNSIARALKEMEKNNLQEKKRQIFSALRSL